MVLCFVSPWSTSAKEKELKGTRALGLSDKIFKMGFDSKNDKAFAVLNLNNSYTIKKDDFIDYDAESTYIIEDAKNTDKSVYLLINVDYKSFFEKEKTENKYESKEEKSKQNINYFYKKSSDDLLGVNHIMIAVDDKKNNFLIYAFDEDFPMAKEIMDSITPANGSHFENPHVLKTLQKNVIHQEIFTSIMYFIIIWLLCLIGKIGIFGKMNVPKWKAVIPFYSDYILFEKTWKAKYLFIIIGIYFITKPLSLYNSISFQFNAYVFLFLLTIPAIIYFLYLWIHYDWIIRSFGRKPNLLLTILLLFFTPIGFAYFAFSKDKYIGNGYDLYWEGIDPPDRKTFYNLFHKYREKGEK